MSFLVILFNTIMYSLLLVLLFSIFFIFDIRVLRTLSEYKFINSLPFLSSSGLLIFLSLAGLPPLFGFLSKFLIFSCLLQLKNIFLLGLLMIFNLFVMYFYIQNVRFIVNKSIHHNIYIYSFFKVYLNFTLVLILALGFYINIFAFLHIEYFFTLLKQLTIFIKIF